MIANAKFLGPRHSHEAEQGIIGGLFLEPSLFSEVAAILTPEAFYTDRHEVTYRLMLELYHAGHPLDYYAVVALAQKRGIEGRIGGVGYATSTSLGGLEYLRECIDLTPSSAHTLYHAEVVRQYAITRRLLDVGQQIVKLALNPEHDCEHQLDMAERLVMEIGSERPGTEDVTIGELGIKTIQRIYQRSLGEIKGTTTGFGDVDQMVGGLDAGALVIVAGRPSMGKTAWSMNVAENIARTGTPVYVASIEQGGLELGERMLSGMTGIDSNRFKGRTRLSPEDWRLLSGAQEEMLALPISVCDAVKQSAQSIVSSVRRYCKRMGKPCVTIIDHVGHVDVTGEDKHEQRYQQLNFMTRQFKGLAKEIGMPVIVLSQLRREVANREDKTPTLSDLRESGSLEQNADVVLLIHRPDYYNADDEPGISKIIVAKNRNGMVGTANLRFIKHLTKFEDYEEQVNY